MEIPEQHKTVLILGATSGVATPLLQQSVEKSERFTFYLLAKDISKLEDIKKFAEEQNQQVQLITYDLLDAPDLHFHNIQYCIVLAGWLPTDDTETNKTMQVNYLGIKYFIDRLITDNKQTLEQIIITGSIAGVRIRNKNKDYGTAKKALHEYAFQLQNNQHLKFETTLVIPGYIKTKMLEGINTPNILTIKPEKLASKYLIWINKKPRQVYSQPIWKLIALILKMIPDFIMKRLNF